jgi:hypothetical protein
MAAASRRLWSSRSSLGTGTIRVALKGAVMCSADRSGFGTFSRAAEHHAATLTPERELSKPHNPCLRNGGRATVTSTGKDYEKAPLWWNLDITE